MMKALILKSEFWEADVRKILGIYQAIESRKHKPVWYSLLRDARSPGPRDGCRSVVPTTHWAAATDHSAADRVP